jgi:hypothetical protein
MRAAADLALRTHHSGSCLSPVLRFCQNKSSGGRSRPTWLYPSLELCQLFPNHANIKSQPINSSIYLAFPHYNSVPSHFAPLRLTTAASIIDIAHDRALPKRTSPRSPFIALFKLGMLNILKASGPESIERDFASNKSMSRHKKFRCAHEISCDHIHELSCPMPPCCNTVSVSRKTRCYKPSRSRITA